MPRTGNKVSVLSCGKNVLQSIYDAMMSAQKFIYIADWQLAFDVELHGRGQPGYPGRLHKVIEDIISKKPVHVRVLLFCSFKDSLPPLTYDGLVARELTKLNKKGYPGSIRVMLQPPTSAQSDNIDYSHHQKFVVVDGQIAFIGGIDMTYGRWETPNFDVVVDPEIFVINDMYNPCATKLRGTSEIEKKKIENFHFAEPYGGKLIDEGCQPRMPWQDVHIKIEGPSTVDIHRNFARRWNARIKQISPDVSRALQLEPISKTWLNKIGAWPLLAAAQPIKGDGAQVQIVRSVSSQHLKMEGSNPDDLELFHNLNERSNWQECLKTWAAEHQSNILTAMVNCIRSADNYIYIETQFFISQFGQWSEGSNEANAPLVDSSKIGNENNGIKNIIIDELAKRIHQHIVAGTIFHVYLVLPVHPEGSVLDGSVWKQHWMALASIKHGSNSLINQIKKSLGSKKRNLEEWTQYLTVLNMRNYGVTVQYARDPKTMNEDFSREIGRFLITEQIYIHSKLMIVDDAVAIVGSANINDRSLTGNGDTEIAAVVVDTEDVELQDLGSMEFKVQTRKFARELRRELWRKHFGFMVKSAMDKSNYFNSTIRAVRAGKRPPVKLPFPPRLTTTEKQIENIVGDANWQAMLDKPCSPKTVQTIQAIAKHNARIYEEVFQHTPRNNMKNFGSIYDFYSLPYPATFDLFRSAYLQEINRFDSSQSRTKKDEPGQEWDRKSITAAGKGSQYGGVVPPALNSRFMTSNMLPYQQASLRDSSYARRQQLYAGGKIHDVKAAIDYLRDNIVGFFVMSPLDWGMGTAIDDDVSKHITVDVAHVDTDFSPTERIST